MDIGKYKMAQSFRLRPKNLTRNFYLNTKRTLDEEPFAWEQNTPETDYQIEVDPIMVVPPQDVLPKNPIPNMPSAPGIPDPQFRQLELAEGGSVDRQEFGNGGRPAIGVAYERPEVLKIIKNKLKDSVEKKDGFKVVNWTEEKTHPMLIKEFKKNNIKLNNREFINKAITKVFEENNWIDPVQYRREMVVDSFMKHLDTVGEFDGEEKLAKELKPFLGEPATKNKPSKLYETINRDFKDWRAGKFEVSTVDRNALDKNALTEIKNWMPRTTNIRSVQRKEQLEFLNNLNNKNISLDNAKNQFIKKFSNLENPLQTFNQRVGQLNVLKLEGKLPSNKDATQFKTYKNIEIGERAPWLKAGLTDLFAGNYSKTIQAADVLNAEGKTKEAQRLYAAAEKFFSPNDGIFRRAGGQAEHPFSRKYGGTADQQLKVNSLIQGDLNSFKKTNFDDPVNQAIEKYNISTDEKIKKSLQKEIELRKQFMNYITGSKEFGGIVDPVEFEFTPNEVKVKTNIKPIDKIKNFDVDIFKQRGESYGETASNIGKDLGLLTKEGEIANKKIALNKLEKILNEAGVTNEEKKAINLLNRVNFGADPNLVKELYGKEINLVKNAISKIPAPVRAVGKVFGLADVALDAIFALPYLATGDIEGAKRSSTAGLFGWGKSIEEELLGMTKDEKEKEKIKTALNNFTLVPELRDLEEEKQSLEEYLKNPLDEEQASIYFNNLNSVNEKIKNIQDILGKKEFTEEDQKALLNKVNEVAASKAKQAESWFGPELKQAQGPTRQQLVANRLLEEMGIRQFIQDQALKESGYTFTPVEIPEIQSPDDSMRQGFEKGGLSRRGFLGLLTGAAAAPELIKAVKGGKKATQAGRVASKIKFEKAEGMYSWFPDLVEKIKVKGKPFEEKELIMESSYKHQAKGYGGFPTGEEKLTKHIDGDTEFVLREYPDGRIAVDIHSPRNQEGLDTPVTLYYRPTMELTYYNGKKIEPAEFKVLEKEPRYFANGPDDVDIEMSEMRKVPGKNTIYGDVEAAERFATGNIKNRKIIPAKQSRRDQMMDAPVDFIEETSPYGY